MWFCHFRFPFIRSCSSARGLCRRCRAISDMRPIARKISDCSLASFRFVFSLPRPFSVQRNAATGIPSLCALAAKHFEMQHSESLYGPLSCSVRPAPSCAHCGLRVHNPAILYGTLCVTPCVTLAALRPALLSTVFARCCTSSATHRTTDNVPAIVRTHCFGYSSIVGMQSHVFALLATY